MTLTNSDLVSPFLFPGNEVAEDAPRTPFDGSAEAMRRLRDPFAVEPAATRAVSTKAERGEHPGRRGSVPRDASGV